LKRSFHTEGIILKNYRFGEIHRGVVFLSPEIGLQTAVAFGAYSPKGKLRTVTSPLCTGTLYLYRDPVKDMIKITDMDCRLFFSGIRENIRKFFHASFFQEIVLKTFGGEAPSVYDLLVSSLSWLELLPDSRSTELLVQFLWRYVTYAGLAPDLELCSTCGKERNSRDPAYVQVGVPGLLCAECAGIPVTEDPSAEGHVYAGGLEYLRYTEPLPLERALQVQVEEESLHSLKRFLILLIKHLAGGNLNSLRAAEGYL
jgi:DNA repair protein RecO (recombination protein O)